MRRATLAIIASGTLLTAALAQDEQAGFFQRLRQNLFPVEEQSAPAAPVTASDEDKPQLVRLLERQLSTPERRVEIGEVSGLFTREIRVESITVSDPQGAWLTLREVSAVWNRAALFRGRLEMDRLAAGRVSIVRRPTPSNAAERERTGGLGFALPIDVRIDEISLPAIVVGEAVAGEPAILGANGNVAISGDAATAGFDVRRLDGAGGTLTGRLDFRPRDNVLDADIALSEPQGGLAARLLELPNTPALDFRLAGEGPLDDWRAEISLALAGETALAGTARIGREADAYRLSADVRGTLGGLMPEPFASFLSGESRLVIDATRSDSGGVEVSSAELTSEQAKLQASARLAPDFFPESASLRATIGSREGAAPGEGGAPREGGALVGLPFAPGNARLRALTLEADLDADGWRAEGEAQGIAGDFGAIQRLTFSGNGEAENLRTPESRRLTFDMTGEAQGVAPTGSALAQALGESLQFAAEGAWAARRPVEVASSRITSEGLSAGFAGTADADRLQGRYEIEASDLSRLSDLAGMRLEGRASLNAEGAVDLDGGAFDLTLDGNLRNAGTGIAQLDPLIAGEVALTGGLARTTTGLRFRDLRIIGPAARVALNGDLDRPQLGLSVEAQVSELAAIDPRLGGAATLRGQVSGTLDVPRVDLTAEGDGLTLIGKAFEDARLRFAGLLAGPQAGGDVRLSGTLDGVPVEASARLAGLEDGARRLEDLRLTAGRNRASGSVALLANNLLEGELAIDTPDLAAVAPLFLVEANGSLSGRVTLSAEDGAQGARVLAEASDLAVQDVRIRAGTIDATARSLFSQPILEGTFRLEEVSVGRTLVPRIEGSARREGNETRFDVSAALAEGEAQAAGRLTPLENGGLRVALDRLRLARGPLALALAAPGSVTVGGGAVLLDGLDFAVGDGRVTLSGRVGDALDLTARIDRLPAALANAVAPALEAQGLVSGNLRLTGTAADPNATFDLSWRNASLATTRAAGLGTLGIEAKGSLAGRQITFDADITGEPGIVLRASGSLPLDGGDLRAAVTIERLPAALANALRPELGAQGLVSGTLQIEGSPADPQGTFDIVWRDASLAATRRAGVEALMVEAKGRLEEGGADVNATISGAPQISARVSGFVPFWRDGRLALQASVTQLPASLASTFAPDLDPQGAITGTLEITGTATAPRGTFDIAWRDASLAATRAAGLGGLAVAARGDLAGDGVRIEADVTGPPGLTLKISGSVPFSRAGALDLRVDLARLPTALVNSFAPSLALEGTLSGTLLVQGTPGNPRVTFEAQGRDMSVAALRAAGISPLSIDASGRLIDRRVQVEAVVSGAGGVSLRVSGGLPVAGGGRIDLAVQGSVPLAVADQQLAARGAHLTGLLDVDVAIGGTLAAPTYSGTLQARGAGFTDPQTSVSLADISLDARLAGERLTVERLTARSGDGNLNASGAIRLVPDAGFPADIRVSLDDVRYEDERLLAATLDGALTVTGPLTRMPMIGGTVEVRRAEVVVPERLPGNAVLPDVAHIHTPADVLRTLERALPRARPDDNDPSGVNLDLVVNAPARIFVRGRGLDAELGGRVELRGPVSNVTPVGAFELIRGRLNILGQRIVFDHGRLEFAGDLDPILDFQATADSGDISVIVTVTGRASDPRIGFSSEPPLPEDEALAQLLFGRSLSQLSPLQILRLADAAASLGGLGDGGGLLGRLRATTGLDDLDVGVDDKGNPVLQAGRYVNENVYLGVQQGATPGSSRVTIDLDVTKNVKARGAVGSDGSSSLGVYYEKEY